MKIAIIGAGAMGCRIGYQLSQTDASVVLVDTWKEHVEAIRQRGLHVDFNGEESVVDLPIYYPNEVTEPADVVFALPKSMQLAETLEQAKPLLGEETQMVCLLNGLGHEEVMERYLPLKNIVMGTTIWTAQLDGPGKVHLHGVGNMALQNWSTDASAIKKTHTLVDVLNEAGLQASYSTDVREAIWKKVIVNCCTNAGSTLMESNLAGFSGSEHGVHLIREMAKECVAVAATQGVMLDADATADFVVTASLRVGEHHVSMYQDLVANHRLTEIDYLNGYIVRLGQKHRIATPYNDAITRLIHIKEELLVHS